MLNSQLLASIWLPMPYFSTRVDRQMRTETGMATLAWGSQHITESADGHVELHCLPGWSSSLSGFR